MHVHPHTAAARLTGSMGFLRHSSVWPIELVRSGWAFAGVLILATLAYWPGLTGGFLFDDLVNLPALGAWGRIDNPEAFWRYITSGNADPTGRPVALLSFLLDARNWPADPAPFLRTSLLLHLLNGAMLFALLRVLEARLGASAERGIAVATLAAGLWLLHPLFVSTTLYVVQREAMLPASFTLLGLLAWVHARERFTVSTSIASVGLIICFGLCIVLATLSKGNGILLPLFAWVIDATVLQSGVKSRQLPSRRVRLLRGVLLILPSMLVFAFVIWGLRHVGQDLEGRHWTLEQRLLTEPRVFLDYLKLLAIPRVLSTGLYNDAYVVSTGLLQPWSTLPALIVVLAVAIAGFAMRRVAPTLSAALLFFLAGHLLESTTIPLELYFEHRNYLPAMLLGWPIARAVATLKISGRARTALSAGMLMLLAFITWQRAALWAKQDEMAYLWAAKNPASSRAQATAAIFEIHSGRPDLADARLSEQILLRPGDLQLVANRVSAKCRAAGLQPSDRLEVAETLATATEGHQLLHRWLEEALALAREGECNGLDFEVVSDWIEAALANPHVRKMPGRLQDLYSISGQLSIAQGRPERALDDFNRALDAYPTPRAALRQSATLATYGCYREGLLHLDYFTHQGRNMDLEVPLSMQSVHQRVLEAQGYWRNEISRLRAAIKDDEQRVGTRCGK